MDKQSIYEKAIEELKEEFVKTDDLVPRMATVCAVLKNSFSYYFWCGFYFVEEDQLIVGPYQGTLACPAITYEGVCGAAAKKEDTVMVSNVHDFPGHIVCDPDSKSEIVVPVFDKEKRLVAVLDIDSNIMDAFDEVDKKYTEKIVKMLFN